jgi:hypothetical protein
VTKKIPLPSFQSLLARESTEFEAVPGALQERKVPTNLRAMYMGSVAPKTSGKPFLKREIERVIERVPAPVAAELAFEAFADHAFARIAKSRENLFQQVIEQVPAPVVEALAFEAFAVLALPEVLVSEAEHSQKKPAAPRFWAFAELAFAESGALEFEALEFGALAGPAFAKAAKPSS